MRTATATRPPATPARRAAALAAPLAAAVALFLAGRWTAPGQPLPAAVQQASPQRMEAAPSTAALVQPAPVAPGSGSASAPPAPRTAAARRAVGLATEGARAQLEAIRPQLVSRCWPAAGLVGGLERARVTFHLTFDAAGREVARGIGEDRSAPAGELLRCLRALPVGSLSIPPPGARVGVRVAVNFP